MPRWSMTNAGVGKSGGEYEGNQNVSEKNIVLLADDASAALTTLAAHRSLKGIPVGLSGISQAGWIAPVAAQTNSLVKFLVMWSGPVCKVSEEDIFSIYTRESDGKAAPPNDIAPPYEEALRSRKEIYIWPGFLGRDTDSGDDLEKLSIPGLWILSDNDSSIPVDLSIDDCRSCARRLVRFVLSQAWPRQHRSDIHRRDRVDQADGKVTLSAAPARAPCAPRCRAAGPSASNSRGTAP